MLGPLKLVRVPLGSELQLSLILPKVLIDILGGGGGAWKDSNRSMKLATKANYGSWHDLIENIRDHNVLRPRESRLGCERIRKCLSMALLTSQL